MTFLRNLWEEEEGLDQVEYALVFAVFVVMALALIATRNSSKPHPPATTAGGK